MHYLIKKNENDKNTFSEQSKIQLCSHKSKQKMKQNKR